jgi:hypothetical protein
VQDLLAHKKQHARQSRAGRVYLFSGLLFCGRCGHKMNGRMSAGNPTYYCRTYTHQGHGSCDPNHVAESRLLVSLAAKFKESFGGAVVEAFAEALRRELTQPPDPHDARTLADMRRRLSELEALVGQHVRRMMDLPDDLAASARQAAIETKHQRDDLSARVAAADRRATATAGDVEATVSRAVAAVERLSEVLAGGEPAAVKTFLREHLERIELHFEPVVRGEQRERFSRGLVFLKDDSPLFPVIRKQ